MANVEWRTPAPVWSPGSLQSQAPFLAEFAGDNFLPDFLNLMEGRTPDLTPADLANRPAQATGSSLKLYLPAHGRYYLVAGSLVCRQPGLPDRYVDRSAGQRTSFVLRRLVAGAGGAELEQAWVNDGPARGWHTVTPAKQLYPGEERHPMHPVEVCKLKEPGADIFADAFGLSACGRRTIYYGYVPTSARDKYAERYAVPAGDPAEAVAAFFAGVRDDSSLEGDPRLDELDSRVTGIWRSMFVNPVTGAAPPDAASNLDYDSVPAGQRAEVRARLETLSLFLLLDLADYLSRALPDVFAAVVGASPTGLSTAERALYDELGRIRLPRTGDITLAAAIRERADDIALARGEGDLPTKRYDLLHAELVKINDPDDPADDTRTAISASNASYLESVAAGGRLYQRVAAALGEEARPMAVRPEVAELLAAQVAPLPASAERYVLRMVYEHAPCAPVVSARGEPFTIARFFDPDAPARPIRIELPSIDPRDLRKYRPGVGFEMSPRLRDLMNRITKGMLDGEGLSGSPGGWELGMICSFSLQIIFLVAFIVMFIFLIALNFIFWWLPFLKICFPIPVKK